MKIKPGLRLVALAIAAVAVSLALPTSAGASAQQHAPAAHKVNLHAAYERALPHAHHGRVIMTLSRSALRRHGAQAQTQASSCAEPNCNLAYNGGPVQHNPKVYLLLWGPKWGNGPDYSSLYWLYDGLGTSSDSWSAITSQYGDGTGNPVFTGLVFAGAWQDTSTPAGTGPGGSVTQSDLNAEADGFLQAENIAATVDAQVVIAAQSGTCFSDGWAGQPSACTDQPAQNYCGWHTSSSAGETFTNLPYALDAGANCGENFVNAGSAGTYDDYSIVGGHEFAESVTDPYPDSGWVDLNDNTSGGGEVGDKCAWGGGNWGGNDPIGNVAFSTGVFAMQSLWSNAAGACAMPRATITLTSPGAEKTTYGNSASLQIRAADSAANTLTFSAAGLPRGLSIRSSTGTISGKPAVAASYTVTITASDTTGARKSVTFPWAITEPNVYIKANKLAGNLVVDDTNGSHAIGTRAEVWTEAGLPGSSGVLARQSWAVTRVSGTTYDTIRLSGTNLCLDVAGNGTTNGTHVVLWTCNSGAAQQWRPLATGQLEAVNATAKSRRVMVLDDPGTGGIGTKLQIWQSSGVRHQFWTLP